MVRGEVGVVRFAKMSWRADQFGDKSELARGRGLSCREAQPGEAMGSELDQQGAAPVGSAGAKAE